MSVSQYGSPVAAKFSPAGIERSIGIGRDFPRLPAICRNQENPVRTVGLQGLDRELTCVRRPGHLLQHAGLAESEPLRAIPRARVLNPTLQSSMSAGQLTRLSSANFEFEGVDVVIAAVEPDDR
jgi:hypothetical protein